MERRKDDLEGFGFPTLIGWKPRDPSWNMPTMLHLVHRTVLANQPWHAMVKDPCMTDCCECWWERGLLLK